MKADGRIGESESSKTDEERERISRIEDKLRRWSLSLMLFTTDNPRDNPRGCLTCVPHNSQKLYTVSCFFGRLSIPVLEHNVLIWNVI